MKQYDIQQSIYQALVSDTSLMDKVEAVYDNVPQDTTYPYVVIGDDTSVQWDTDDTVGSENTLTLHVWSRYYGRGEVKDIMQAIYACLHRRELEVTGAHTVTCEFDFGESFLDPDGITRHGVIRFRIILQYEGDIS